MFSIVFDDIQGKYKVKALSVLKDDERRNIYGIYSTLFEAKRVLKGISKQQKRHKNSTFSEGV